jgi:hypothetical protein
LTVAVTARFTIDEGAEAERFIIEVGTEGLATGRVAIAEFGGIAVFRSGVVAVVGEVGVGAGQARDGAERSDLGLELAHQAAAFLAVHFQMPWVQWPVPPSRVP